MAGLGIDLSDRRRLRFGVFQARFIKNHSAIDECNVTLELLLGENVLRLIFRDQEIQSRLESGSFMKKTIEWDSSDLDAFAKAVSFSSSRRNITLSSVQVRQRQLDPEVIEVRAGLPNLESDLRTERIEVHFPCYSEEWDCAVLWARLIVSVPSEDSYYFPVPERYGEQVELEFNWEFDPETLECGPACIRDKDCVHYAPVLPDERLQWFVECVRDAAAEAGAI